MRFSRTVVALLLILPLVAVAVAGVGGGIGEDDSVTVTVTYDAGYVTGISGTADVIRYAKPDGEVVELTDEPLPWESPALGFGTDGDLMLVVETSALTDVALTCAARTDQGPYGREAVASSLDPTCRVETTLEALERD